MFSVDEATAEAIRRAYDEGGELAGVVEFRRHFPLITDNAKAGECVRIIAGWKPRPDRKPKAPAPRPRRVLEAQEHPIPSELGMRGISCSGCTLRRGPATLVGCHHPRPETVPTKSGPKDGRGRILGRG